MNLKKLINFSNIYSQQNKDFMSRLPNRLNITPKKQPSSNRKSEHKSHSPALKAKRQQASIFNISKLEQNKKINKLQLGKEKIQEINYALELQAKSRKQFEKRQKAKDHYINYDKNPFTDRQSKKVKTEMEQKQLKSNRKPYKNIIDAVTSQRQTNFFLQLKNKAQKLQSSANTYLLKMQKISGRQNFHPQFFDVQKTIQQQQQHQDIKTQKSALKELDQIVSIRQQSYFKVKRDREPFNLFELKFNPKSIMFQSGRQQLKTYYFSVDSMPTNTQSRLNQIFMRSLSTYARISAVKSSSKQIPKDFKLTEINRMFDENRQSIANSFIFVANGQVTPSLVLKYYNEDDVDTDKQQQAQQIADQQIVIYRPNWKDKAQDWGVQNQDNAEMKYYNDMTLTKTQNRQIKLSNNYLKDIKNVQSNQMNCLTKSIKDKKLMQKFDQQKMMLLSLQMDADINVGRNTGTIERRVRMNKLNKNRAEKLKINIVKHTFKQMKQVENVIKKTNQQRR